jgi:hypothetical protein
MELIDRYNLIKNRALIPPSGEMEYLNPTSQLSVLKIFT